MSINVNLKAGRKFKSTPLGFDIIIKITKLDLLHNELSVEYLSRIGQKMEDVWNLEHCIWAFERGEYILID